MAQACPDRWLKPHRTGGSAAPESLWFPFDRTDGFLSSGQAVSPHKNIHFVDSKDLGEELRKHIKDNNKKIEASGKKGLTVSFVTADYMEDEESSQQVASIVGKEKTTADVLISTSVLDNGINIADEKLRSIIIMADNETEFIQMLGRRRKGTERVAVYAFLYEKEHFTKRYNANLNRKRIGHDFMANALATIGNAALKGQLISQLNDQEMTSAVQHSRYLVNNIFSILDRIKYTHFSYKGMICLNPLSVCNLDNLDAFYSDMIEQFDSGDNDAFMKEVVRWLDMEEQFDLEYAKLNRYEKARRKVIENFEAKINKPMAKKEYEIEVRKPVEKELAVLIEAKKTCLTEKAYKTFIVDCRRSGRVITGPMMDFLCKHCDIPYKVINPEKEVYEIKAVTEESKNLQQTEPVDNPQN